MYSDLIGIWRETTEPILGCSDAQLSAQTSMYFGAHLTFHDILCSLYVVPLVSQKNKAGGLGIF